MDLLYAPLSYYRQSLRVVEGEIDRAPFPIANYDELNIAEISKHIDRLCAAQIREIREYEKGNKNRETLIDQFDRKLKADRYLSKSFRCPFFSFMVPLR
jgi:hypothetical protein